MKILAVDTSGNHLTVLLLNGDEPLYFFSQNIGLKHSITLMTEVENLLEKAGIELSDIDVFSTVVGPGSFTGIRIGVATVKAWAYAFNKKVLPVTSFEVLAYNSVEKRVLCAIDARHDNYYACGFDGGEMSISPRFVNGEELNNLCKDYTLVTDKGADYVKGLILAIEKKLPLATDDREALIPLYVKKSQAEEERK
ncbi:MAG: tRNA (adenosine(37)-N6)-threonylcarbamoyltransferase complex dimerization subunit type 1 TsaB [Clostridia bacterium]|nr:tRNA (adenosine(37)-N6)-threonylcarbamoyltransferase complex dimerization subunit type 1 TsaB [Clostridia bacterium]